MGGEISAGESVLEALLSEVGLTAPDDLAALLARHARGVGSTETVTYLVDLQQQRLIPLSGHGVPDREPLSVDTTLAGRCFRTVTVMHAPVDGGSERRVWVPLLDGVERLGVVEFVVPELDAITERRLRAITSLMGELVLSKSLYSETLQLVRRSRPMTLQAEIQWSLLPPLTYGCPRVVISGMLEPAYEVAGDSFDYGVRGDIVHIGIFDAKGHGVEAGLLATLAVGAYRSARRSGLRLADVAYSMDRAVAEQFAPEGFVTAVLAELDLVTGELHYAIAGHPGPLLLRSGKVVKSLDGSPGLPLGLGHPHPSVSSESLEPGDRLLFYSDGVVEARSQGGEFFGLDRLADFVIREAAAGQPTPETMRRLVQAVLAHQHDRLQDDATMLVVEWLTGSDTNLEV